MSPVSSSSRSLTRPVQQHAQNAIITRNVPVMNRQVPNYSRSETKSPTWPAPSIIIIAIFVLHIEPLITCLCIDLIVPITLQMWVYNSNHLTAFTRYIVDHLLRVREFVGIPCKEPVKWKANQPRKTLTTISPPWRGF